MMKVEYPLISYWKNVAVVYEEKNEENVFVVIVGVYNHENSEETPNVCIGVHWDNYPLARKTLAPCVLQKNAGIDILNGRLQRIANDEKLKTEEKIDAAKKVIEALERLNKNQ
ncbi:MAG: hypothetical protein ACRCWR_06345 [Saezia sp.]